MPLEDGRHRRLPLDALQLRAGPFVAGQRTRELGDLQGELPLPDRGADEGIDLARGGIVDALTTEQISQLLEDKPDWLIIERESYQQVLRDQRRIKAMHADQAREG